MWQLSTTKMPWIYPSGPEIYFTLCLMIALLGDGCSVDFKANREGSSWLGGRSFERSISFGSFTIYAHPIITISLDSSTGIWFMFLSCSSGMSSRLDKSSKVSPSLVTYSMNWSLVLSQKFCMNIYLKRGCSWVIYFSVMALLLLASSKIGHYSEVSCSKWIWSSFNAYFFFGVVCTNKLMYMLFVLVIKHLELIGYT